MKILLLGAGGQVGTELVPALDPLGTLIRWDRASADLEDTAGMNEKLEAVAPHVIVNAAAYTAVDRAESEPDLARLVNAAAVDTLARYSRSRGALLVHYSTDYVFDGAKEGPYQETDAPNPINVYGQTKLEGEEFIRSSGCRHLIFRTSWVFAPKGRNFARTMLGLAARRDELRVVSDQYGVPTEARLIAEVTAAAVGKLLGSDSAQDPQMGTYHLCAGGETSWYEYARFLLSEAGRFGYSMRVDPDRIYPISTSDYPQPAKRPPNSRLSTGKLRRWLGSDLPPWQAGVTRAVREILGESGGFPAGGATER